MSYSRWSHSDWYTFWSAGTDATLCMWPSARIVDATENDAPLYSADFDDLDGVTIDALAAMVPRVTNRADVEELLELVREFCDDVREQRAHAERVRAGLAPKDPS